VFATGGDGSYDLLDYTRWNSRAKWCPVIFRDPFNTGAEADIAPTFTELLRMLTIELEVDELYCDENHRDGAALESRMLARGTGSLQAR